MRNLLMSLFLSTVFLLPASAQQSVEGEQSAQPPQTSTQATVQEVKNEIAQNSFFNYMEKSVLIIQSKLLGSGPGGLNSALFDAGFKSSDRVMDGAKMIAGGLALVYLVYHAMLLMASGGNASWTQMIADVILPVSFAAFLLTQYKLFMGLFAGTDGMLQFVRDLGGSPASDFLKMFSGFLGVISTSIGTAAAKLTSIASLFEVSNTIVALGDLALTAIFGLVCIAFSAAASVELIALLLLGPFQTAVAIAVGPVFIACLVTPWTRDYFNKWVTFTISSALLTGVLGVIIGLATKLVDIFEWEKYAQKIPNAALILLLMIMILTIKTLVQDATGTVVALTGNIGSKGSGIANGIREAMDSVKGQGRQAANDMNRAFQSAKARKFSGETPNIGSKKSDLNWGE